MKDIYEVEIMGQKFNIRSSESPAHVNNIIAYITEKMKKISRNQKSMSLHDLAILALLNITDEMFKYRQEMGEYKENIVRKTKHILQLIDVKA